MFNVMVNLDWILKSGHSYWFWVFFILFCCLLHLTVMTSPSSIFRSRYNLNSREHSNLAICTKLNGYSIKGYATTRDFALSTVDLISVSFARELITLKRCRSIIMWNLTMKIAILIWNFNCSVVKLFPKPLRMTWHNTDAVWWKSVVGF